MGFRFLEREYGEEIEDMLTTIQNQLDVDEKVTISPWLLGRLRSGVDLTLSAIMTYCP